MKRSLWLALGGIAGAVGVGVAHGEYAVSKARRTRESGMRSLSRDGNAYCSTHPETWGKFPGTEIGSCSKSGQWAPPVGMVSPTLLDSWARKDGQALGALVGGLLGVATAYVATR